MPQRFEQAARCLPPQLRKEALALPERVRAQAEEIRLRAGQVMVIRGADETCTASVVTPGDLRGTLESGGSLHTVLESLRHGFVSLPGGHRLGVCGSAAVKDGQVAHIRDISSVCIRVVREKKGIAVKLLPSLVVSGRLSNTLILSPPGAGKTTLLRDLIRILSDGSPALAPMRVSVADERGEIAACYGGAPQLDVGRRTDVMSGVHKPEAAMMMLRGMCPQVLALDEVTAPEDAGVITACAGCGVTVLSTAHAAGLEDLNKRPVYRGLLDYFDRVVVISGTGATRKYEVLEVRETCCRQSA